MSADAPAADKQLRACNSCTMCCKVVAVAALRKPPQRWCSHCRPGRGCEIYADRPEECRTFNCLYLVAPGLSEDWQPETAKMVLAIEENGRRIGVHVDSTRPDAWRREPYYSKLKELARKSPPPNTVIVHIAPHAYAILPDSDVHLGVVGPEERIIAETVQTPRGPLYNARKIHVSDPLAWRPDNA